MKKNEEIEEEEKNNKKEIGDNLNDFTFLELLSKGQFGFVAKVKSKKNNQIYAMKCYKNMEDNSSFLAEVVLLRKLNHENICKYYLYFKDEKKDSIYIIMEYIDNGSLLNLLISHKDLQKEIKLEKLYDIFLQCLRGLKYIHKFGIIHRDIKPAHFVINSYGQVKLIDFKRACVSSKEKVKDFLDTKISEINEDNLVKKEDFKIRAGNFSAPELNNDIDKYDEKIDVYSLGITFCSLLFFTTSLPSEDNVKNDRQDLFKIIKAMLEKQEKRKDSKSVYAELKQLYIKNLITKNNDLDCVIKCLFSLSTLNELLSQYSNNYDQKTLNGKCTKLFISQNSKEEWENNLFNLRKKMYKKGFNQLLIRNHKRIEPAYIINYLIIEMNEEFKRLKRQIDNANKNNNGNDVCKTYELRKNEENAKQYIGYFKNTFKTPFSDYIFNILKNIRTCQACKKYHEYSFNFIYSIRFDIKFLLEKYPNEKIIDINQAFDCYNKNYTLNAGKNITFTHKCSEDRDGNNANIEVKKEFYELAQNLIIFLDRGENCINKEYISFGETLNLNNNLYFLTGVICRIEKFNKDEKKREVKYIYYIREKNNTQYSSNVGEDGKLHDFNNIKYTGDIIHLFYEKNNYNNNNNFNNTFLNKD